ncbi:hypothetical protein O181_065099 [Austropuccinia psidii MF-1]|uniref:DDE Tnp4 domain-containing protein n=1 Tax=Austropuccinia psidii MF-1 TaxID=1389203 RepID=A0A9Q3I477_9BASI|nr:hypothetical protein [Austropuccinia psidii MF-1]
MCLITPIEENGINIAEKTYGQDNRDSDKFLQAHNSSQLYSLALHLTMHSRYLSRPLVTVANHAFNIDGLFQMRDDDFKQAMKTSKDVFIYIYNKIKDHSSFQNHSTCKQLPISHQLALTLERLGSNGNAGLVGKFARNFNVGHGTVVLITRRVIRAINSYKEEYIKWPNSHRQCEISYLMRQEGFEGCMGFINGTTFPLCQKPAWQGEVYFDRKTVYSINAQVLCDCDKRIIAIMAGWPGSCADSMVYKNMGLYKNPHKFFDIGQYLLADSAPVSQSLSKSQSRSNPHSNSQSHEDFFSFTFAPKPETIHHQCLQNSLLNSIQNANLNPNLNLILTHSYLHHHLQNRPNTTTTTTNVNTTPTTKLLSPPSSNENFNPSVDFSGHSLTTSISPLNSSFNSSIKPFTSQFAYNVPPTTSSIQSNLITPQNISLISSFIISIKFFILYPSNLINPQNISFISSFIISIKFFILYPS